MAQAVISEDRNSHAGDQMQYRLYVVAAYPLFLIGAVLGRLTSFGRKPAAIGYTRRRSVFGEAAESVRSTIPWVFSGR